MPFIQVQRSMGTPSLSSYYTKIDFRCNFNNNVMCMMPTVAKFSTFSSVEKLNMNFASLSVAWFSGFLLGDKK
jgi:hypothetical protein